ncbi:MAG: c-type cytochrome [Methyloceanibacter sp.]|nr:c-type cytochrome [Methyloceanibacter sp.]
MKYYRFNQIAMAVLGALLLFFGAKTIVNIAYEEHEPEKPGYEVSGSEEHPAGGGGEVKPGGGAELATLLAGADPTRGADVAKKCAICHNFDKGGPNMIGPNLYGVLGRKIASHEGYEYSGVLKAKEGDWDYEQINHMIENPNVFAPGTKMALFPGLPDAKQRADVIVFLRTKNDNPSPLPEVTAGGEEKPGGEKPGGEAAAGGSQSEVIALLATTDPKQGEADAGLCKVCHTFDKGGAALVGPNLYDVIGRKIASVEGFNYTPALKAHEGEWTYENLDPWLKNPQAFAPGTMMVFPGIPDAKKRANVIAFMRSKSDNPAPLPEAAAGGEAKPEEKATEAPAAPEEAAPPAEEAAPPAEEAPPAAEEPAPSEEAPAAEPEAPAAPEEAAPSEEKPPADAETMPPEEETAPSAETPPAEPETMAPEEEPASSDQAEPSMGEPPSPSQPQPVYPDETAAPDEDPASSGQAEPSMGEPPSTSQPQPVYPDGPPEGVE